MTAVESNESVSYDEILKSSESELWLKTMESEMDSLYKSSLELDRSWYICFIETIKEFVSNKIRMNQVFTRKVSGSAVVFPGVVCR